MNSHVTDQNLKKANFTECDAYMRKSWHGIKVPTFVGERGDKTKESHTNAKWEGTRFGLV